MHVLSAISVAEVAREAHSGRQQMQHLITTPIGARRKVPYFCALAFCLWPAGMTIALSSCHITPKYYGPINTLTFIIRYHSVGNIMEAHLQTKYAFARFVT